MRFKKNKRFIVLFICSSFLFQCTPVTSSQPIMKQSAPAKLLPAQAYLDLAKDQPEKEQTWQIMAAASYLDAGNLSQSEGILAQTHDLSAADEDKKNILLANTALRKDKLSSAINVLTKINKTQELPVFYQALYHETLAQAYAARGNITDSVQQRIQLSTFIADEETRFANSRAIWQDLRKMPPEELNTLSLESENDPVLQGWAELASLAKQSALKNNLPAAVQQWQQQHPRHPANEVISPNAGAIAVVNKPKKVALLLPLSGVLGGPGHAVEEGFIAASQQYMRCPLQIRTYDTVNKDVAALYQQAVNEGAEFIVGPLTKADVATIGALPHPVPTFLLNEWQADNSPLLYSLYLSPTEEAKAAALKAHGKGLNNALVIVPNNRWGQDVSLAFTQTWQQQGGVLVDTFIYDDMQNLNEGLREFLQVSQKDAYEKPDKKDLEEALPETAKRRQDFDMIFLLAYTSKARQIMPLLKYFFAGNIPVYATSSVYGGNVNRLRDKDLDGITFCDLPWVIEHTPQISKNWPEQLNNYARLYALGRASFKAIDDINQIVVFSPIYLHQGQINLDLVWNEFKNGLAVKQRMTL